MTMTNIEICKLAGALLNREWKRANSIEAAERKFFLAATENGMPEAEARRILSLDFKAAMAACTAHYDAAQGCAPVAEAAPEPVAEAAQEAPKPAKAARKAKAAPVEAEAEAPAPISAAAKKAALDARKAAKTKDEDKPARPISKRAALEAECAKGILPAAPDFSADTHARFRKKLEEIVGLAKEAFAFHDPEALAQLKAYPINPISSSPKAMDKYRRLAVMAIEARYQAKGWETQPGKKKAA